MTPAIDPEALPRLAASYSLSTPGFELEAAALSVNTAAAAVRSGPVRYFLKRYDLRRGSLSDLEGEHRLVTHLAAAGYPTPAPIPNREGQTLSWLEGVPYALYPWAEGEDRYRDAPVFAPFRSLAEARSAGRHLGWLHRLGEGLPRLAPRVRRGMAASLQLLRAPDLELAFEACLDQEPGLRALVQARAERETLVEGLQRPRAAMQGGWAALPSGPLHGDFIKRNLLWNAQEVVSILDFDLWNHEVLVLDLILALLPCGFDWPELLAGRGEVDLAAMKAMLQGYQAERPLNASERSALEILLPAARIEFYLGAIAQWLRQGEPETANRFWELLLATQRWFAPPRRLPSLF